MRLRKSPDEDAVALADFLRRLDRSHVRNQLIGVRVNDKDFYLLSSDTNRRIVALTDPVPGEVVRDIADAFDLDHVALHFDKTERDIH